MPMKFHGGWIRQGYDPRDVWAILPMRRLTSQPPTCDLDMSKVPLLDQGAEGSCGPNSFCEMVYKLQDLQEQALAGAARLYVYWWTRYLLGTVNQDSGVDNRTMMLAGAQYGYPAEASDPYDDTVASMIRQPSSALVAEAVPNRITDYAAVVQSLPQMRGILLEGRPFLFGFDVYQSMLSDEVSETGIVPMPGHGDFPVGGHDVTMCGYTLVDQPGVTPGKKWPANHFKFRNHWRKSDGTWWGDEGCGYVPYTFAASPRFAGDFWMLGSVPGIVPVNGGSNWVYKVTIDRTTGLPKIVQQ